MSTEILLKDYLTCATDEVERYNRIQAVIRALEDQALIAAATSDLSEYSLNDGQVTIRTGYRTPAEIAKAIDVFEAIAERIENRCGGRVFQLKDARSFNLIQRYGLTGG